MKHFPSPFCIFTSLSKLGSWQTAARRHRHGFGSRHVVSARDLAIADPAALRSGFYQRRWGSELWQALGTSFILKYEDSPLGSLPRSCPSWPRRGSRAGSSCAADGRALRAVGARRVGGRGEEWRDLSGLPHSPLIITHLWILELYFLTSPGMWGNSYLQKQALCFRPTCIIGWPFLVI